MMKREDRPTKLIDVVMPALNEGQCIGHTIETLFASVAELPFRFELIVVDDGSTDDTAAVVEQFERRFPIRLVSLTRNFGKETALLAGLDHARGDATIIMDADLQHPTELVGKFVDHWREGYDCVYAVRQDRDDESILKRLFTRLFYYSVNRNTKVRIPRNALDFRLLDRAAVRALCSMRERVRFTKGLYAWLGFRSIAVPIVPSARHAGASRFGFRSLVQLGWDGLTSFSDWPLKLSGAVGFVVAAISMAYGIYIAVRTLVLGIDVPGWATIVVVVCFVGGVQLLFLGIIGQYMRSIFIESKQRPNYLIRDVSQSTLCLRQREPLRDAAEAAAAAGASSAEPRSRSKAASDAA